MTRRIWLGLAVVVGAGIAVGAAAFAVFGDGAEADPNDIPFHAEKPAAAYSSSQICSLLDAEGNGASITGQDGGTTNIVDGTVYWTFGDTVIPASGLPNNIATSRDVQPDDCLDMDHKVDAGGVAAPLLPVTDGEISVWAAAGQISVRPNTVHFLFNSVRFADNRSGDFQIDSIGLATFDTRTLEATRVIDPLLTQRDFDDPDVRLTSATDLLVHEGYVYVYVAAGWNTRVGRVPVDAIEERASYAWWDGASWSADAASAVDIVRTAGGTNALNVDWNPMLGKWTAIYSTDTLAAVAIAYADAPEGPFVDETVLFGCTDLQYRVNTVEPGTGFPQLMRPLNPQFRNSYYCYHATQHPEFDPPGREAIYLTYANLAFYRLFLHRVQLGVPIVQWDDASGIARYVPANAPGGGDGGGAGGAAGTRRGVAFYAPVVPSDGLSTIYEWVNESTGAVRYETTSPGDGFAERGDAFYASMAPAPGLAPVYRWELESDASRFIYSTFDLDGRGYREAGVAFYAATLDGQRFYEEGDGVYVYWVRVKGKQDFGCCGATNNPTRQTREGSVEYTLATAPADEGYEAIVCSPVCGTGGRVVWSGDVEFEPNEPGGKLKLTPKGPR